MYSSSAPHATTLVSWSDSDWGVRRSTTGMCHMLAGGSIGASSKRQDCVTTSSTHAEIVACSTTSSETLWFRGLLGDLGLPQLAATKIMVDNSNVLTLVQNLLSTNKVRHIKRRELVWFASARLMVG